MSAHMPTSLAHLLAGAGRTVVSGNPDVTVSSIATDSRRVEPDALFVCLPGTAADGHDFATAAVAAGAVAIVAQHDVDVGPNIPVVIVNDTRTALSHLAAAFYGRPSETMTIVGVTGTNGKTTTTHLIEAIARAAGKPFGLIGTLGARLRHTFEEPVENTTPPAHELQQLLARMQSAGATGAVLEVSSHALALHRVDDVAFDVAVFTNLTQDHLDFHASFDEYRDAKRKLFELTGGSKGKHGGVAVLNVDDPEGEALSRRAKRSLTFGIDNPVALFLARDIEYGVSGSSFHVSALRPAPFFVRLPGPFNVSNALAALAVGAALDFDVEAIAEGLASVEGVSGRMTPVAVGDVSVYVDYAHTPDGLRKVLEAARSFARNRLICVFGCGGDRDPFKRPIMGALARELSDVAIVTSDNPRFEDPAKIIADVESGLKQAAGGSYEIIADRAAAIERAIDIARTGDVVIIAGKGHEAYQLIADRRIPFSDVAVAQAALQRAGAC